MRKCNSVLTVCDNKQKYIQLPHYKEMMESINTEILPEIDEVICIIK
jgi:hypothetical protein